MSLTESNSHTHMEQPVLGKEHATGIRGRGNPPYANTNGNPIEIPKKRSGAPGGTALDAGEIPGGHELPPVGLEGRAPRRRGTPTIPGPGWGESGTIPTRRGSVGPPNPPPGGERRARSEMGSSQRGWGNGWDSSRVKGGEDADDTDGLYEINSIIEITINTLGIGGNETETCKLLLIQEILCGGTVLFGKLMIGNGHYTSTGIPGVQSRKRRHFPDIVMSHDRFSTSFGFFLGSP